MGFGYGSVDSSHVGSFGVVVSLVTGTFNYQRFELTTGRSGKTSKGGSQENGWPGK